MSMDANGDTIRPGATVRWEGEDGGAWTGRYRCALAVDPAVAIVITPDDTLVRVLHAELTVQRPNAVRGPNPARWADR